MMMEATKGRTMNDISMLNRLQELLEQACNSGEESDEGMDDLASKARAILVGHGKRFEETNFEDLEACFNSCEESLTMGDKNKEFEIIQDFIRREQDLGRLRRSETRRHGAREEKRLAKDLAELKGFRFKALLISTHEDLQQKIADAERSYLSRKITVAKSAQVAFAECRLQFSRVREFFDELHQSRSAALRRQYRRSIQLQAITHRLRNTDSRVAALERQIANRLYQKKKTDLNELHMTQNLEEAMYLESMLDLLNQVQVGKETAAREMFDLHIEYLKKQRSANAKRSEDLENLRAEATLAMANVVAHYTDEEDHNNEAEEKVRENVDAMERRKDFDSSIPIMSVSRLYDTVLWSVATSHVGLSSSSGSSMYSSDYGSDDMSDDGNEGEGDGPKDDELLDLDQDLTGWDESQQGPWKKEDMAFNDTASTQGSTCDGTVGGGNDVAGKSGISLVGNIHVSRLSRELRQKEKAFIEQHDAELKRERRKYRAEARALRSKHERLVESLLQNCLCKRHHLREAIAQRMNALDRKQQESTQQLRRVIENDVKVMQEALRAEDQRLEDAEKTSFIKAQELISAQVFHEVRNALSSMISMSEMTSSLKKDGSLSPTDLVASVDDMLEQIKEVVNYSLNMLNNILDVSKIKSGSFSIDNKNFDLQDLVTRATRMQLAKAGRVNMSFVPNPEPCIAHSDSDIVVRIIANFISNSIKFTPAGAIQPFVWPLDDMFPDQAEACIASDSSISSCGSKEEMSDAGEEHAHCGPDKTFSMENRDYKRATSSGETALSTVCSEKFSLSDKPKTRLVAVGVADTGSGLSKKILRFSENGLSSSDTSSMVQCVRNSGFGLHLAHLLAKALGSKLSLSTLDQCRHLLNADMIDAMNEYSRLEDKRQARQEEDKGAASDGSSSKIDEFCDISTVSCGTDDYESEVSAESSHSRGSKRNMPGSGTVLYITLPIHVFESKDVEMLAIQDAADVEASTSDCDRRSYLCCTSTDELTQTDFIFCPRPSPTSADGTFRILVADDVKMLRKGLVHGLLKLFSHVPISIFTACTAEDVLRIAENEPLDLIICDNQFLHDPAEIRPLAKKDKPRPRILVDKNEKSRSETHRLVSDYFENERFTLEEGDGLLSGFETLSRLANAKELPFPTPILILLSGHKWDRPPSPGVIVVQKPLKHAEFAPLLEAYAQQLLQYGFCTEAVDDHDGKTLLLNRHGSQLYIKK